MAPLRLLTCAKVNLFLRVLGRRADGYHEIETVFQTIDLCDALSVTPGPPGSIDVRARLVGEAAGELPASQDNLVTKAWAALGGPSRSPGVRVEIDKRIPVGGGLGGGSANAAGMLVAFQEMWGLTLSAPDLVAIALDVGSDVPFFLRGGTAVGTGRGEVLRGLGHAGGLWFVLGISERSLSSAEVYSLWRPAEAPSLTPAALVDALRAGDIEAISARLHNDLEPYALRLRPELGDKKAALLRAGAHAAVVSGSGPTLFGLAADKPHARAVAAQVKGSFDRVEIVRSCSRAVQRLE